MIKTLLLLTALALVQARPSDDAEPISSRLYEAHEDCPPYEIHFLLPHEYDCTKFYYCEYGLKFIEPRDCAPGTEFNALWQVCVHPVSSGCTLPGFNTTPGDGVGGTTWPTSTAGIVEPSTTRAPETEPTTPDVTTAEPTTPDVTTSESTNPDVIIPEVSTTEAPIGSTTSVPDPDDCETLDNGCPADFSIHKLLPHEEYCHKFYYCDKGELVLRYCAPGTYFNPKIEVCDWPHNVDCVNDGSYEYPTTSVPETPPPSPPGGGDNDIGDVLDNGCPADFDVHHLLPHETECNKFYYCVFGEKVERSCAPGTYFNYEIQVCDWPANVNCTSTPTTPGGPSEDTSSSEELPIVSDPEVPEDPIEWVPLPNGCPADFTIEQLLPHESDCGKFYHCVHGQLLQRDCPAGTHFSPSQQICDWPQNAGCEHWTGGCNGGSGGGNGGCTVTAAPGDNDGTTAAPGGNDGTTAAPGGNDGTTAAPGGNDGTTAAPGGNDGTTAAPGGNDGTTAAPEGPIEWEPLPNGCPADFDVHHLLPHESDCNKFYYCDHGQTFERECPAGTHFSPSQQICDWPQYAGCEHYDGGCSGAGDDNGGCAGTTAAPGGNDGSTAGPGGNDGTTAAPGGNDGTTAAPGGNDGTTAAPGGNDGTTAAPGGNDGTTAAPGGNDGTTAAPGGNDGTTAAPGGNDGTTAAPGDNDGTTAAPGGNDGTTAAPGCEACQPVTPADKCKGGCNVLPFVHDNDCDKYWICNGEQPVLVTCSEGLHFNPSTNTCDFICNAGCVRANVQITTLSEGVKMFLPWGSITSEMMSLLNAELNADL